MHRPISVAESCATLPETAAVAHSQQEIHAADPVHSGHQQQIRK